MARFDVYWQDGIYLLDVQTDLLDGLVTRIVVPLVPLPNAPRPAGRLNPIFDVDGQPCALQPQLMSSIPANVLGKPVGNLMRHQDRISWAIEMIFNGF